MRVFGQVRVPCARLQLLVARAAVAAAADVSAAGPAGCKHAALLAATPWRSGADVAGHDVYSANTEVRHYTQMRCVAQFGDRSMASTVVRLGPGWSIVDCLRRLRAAHIFYWSAEWSMADVRASICPHPAPMGRKRP